MCESGEGKEGHGVGERARGVRGGEGGRGRGREGRARRGREGRGGQGGEGGDQYTWRGSVGPRVLAYTFLSSRPARVAVRRQRLRPSASAGLSGGSGGGEHGTPARLSSLGPRRAAESHVAAAETSREAQTVANSGRVRERPPGAVTADRTVQWRPPGRCAGGDLWGRSVLEAEEKEDLAPVVWLSS